MGRVNFFGQAHQTHRFAVAFGARHTEIAQDFFFGIAAFLMADHHHTLPVETRQAADDGTVVGEHAISVQLFKIGEQGFDIVQRVRALRMACHLRNLPSA